MNLLKKDVYNSVSETELKKGFVSWLFWALKTYVPAVFDYIHIWQEIVKENDKFL